MEAVSKIHLHVKFRYYFKIKGTKPKTTKNRSGYRFSLFKDCQIWNLFWKNKFWNLKESLMSMLQMMF